MVAGLPPDVRPKRGRRYNTWRIVVDGWRWSSNAEAAEDEDFDEFSLQIRASSDWSPAIESTPVNGCLRRHLHRGSASRPQCFLRWWGSQQGAMVRRNGLWAACVLAKNDPNTSTVQLLLLFSGSMAMRASQGWSQDFRKMVSPLNL
jgi:hypothetical protein